MEGNVKTGLDKTNFELRRARKEFLKEKIRFQILESIILSGDLPSELERRVDVIEEVTKTIVSPPPVASSKPVLDKTTVDIFKSHINNLLLARVLSLLSHWPGQANDSANEYTRANYLPDLVKTDLACLKAAKSSSYNDSAIGQILDQNFNVLHRISEEFCLGRVFQFNAVNLEYNQTKKKTLELKLAYMQKEILLKTYDHQAIEALQKIRSCILSALKEVSMEIERTKASLRQYQMTGSEFELIVEKYAKVQAEIQGKKWALKELTE